MKIAIMQPYFFPYIGYFQMLGKADVFVFYDNADYQKRGWINRNRLLINREAKLFTVSVQKSKLGDSINSVQLFEFDKWKTNFLKTIELNYKKAPHYKVTFALIHTILESKNNNLISVLAENSVTLISEFLGLEKQFVRASSLDINLNKGKEEKLEEVVAILKSSELVLPPGSSELYENWEPKNVTKKTLELPIVKYYQGQKSFVSNLSIIDVLMFNDKEEVNKMIKSVCYK